MKKRLMALLLSGVLAVSMFAGCGTQMDKTAIIATDGTTEISLGLANFIVRLTQSQYDDFYVSYFGEGVWNTDIYGNGTTAGYELKMTVMDEIMGLYALKNHSEEYGISISEEDRAAISAAAEAFINTNSTEALQALGAEREYVEAYLELLTIQDRMYKEIIKGADTNVSDEEAKTSKYSQVYVSKSSYTDEEGNSKTYTDEEKELLAKTVKEFADAAKANGLAAAAETYGYNVTTGTYNESSSALEEIKTALAAMTEDGAVSGLIELENAYYVLQMDAVTDASATEANRQNIIAERQSTRYTEVLDGYLEETNWEVEQKLWEQITFDNLFTMYLPEETEEAEGTEVQ